MLRDLQKKKDRSLDKKAIGELCHWGSSQAKLYSLVDDFTHYLLFEK